MTLAVSVQGGTGAGTRRPLKDRYGTWLCPCGRVNQGFVVRCLVPGCNQERPK